MEKEKLIKIVNTAENASNNDLITAENMIKDEFDKTKALIIDLTRHLDSLIVMSETITKEYNKRTIK